MNKFYTCRYDLAFKYVMLNEDNIEILKIILEFILKERINKIKLLKTELTQDNISIKGKRVDAYVETDNNKINIEVNSNYKDYIHIRNMAYMCNFYEKNYLSGKQYDYNDNFIQINLTYGLSKKDNKLIRKYELRDVDGKIFVENFIIYEINMDKIMKFWYDRDEKKIDEFKHLIMLDLKLEDLRFLSKDKVIKKFMEKIKKVNDDPKFQAYMTYEEDQEKIKNTEIAEATKKGIEQGIEQGIKEGIDKGIIQTIKNMKKAKISLQKISEITGYSVDEISKL